ncbi:hypothetical protein [Mycobacterium sp. shizuoka-1]|uniref:hypothetical protein n=1 Tax=Mycobacterium sp. shizuoka-1 TaxID=2039281 RepID=UPI000C0645BB|nr:hypothetical protein [Mycobacterium sp. shizuoka-1]GAY13962.1 hypothetical protein MSZK_06880 [Mycobacterium sp. shizuoka-1]
MRIVVVVAAAGLVALLVAILTDNTFVAVGVIGLAALGILLLVRDWRSDRRQPAVEAAAETDVAVAEQVDPTMSPEMFAPDISADGRGPSSDARAD